MAPLHLRNVVTEKFTVVVILIHILHRGGVTKILVQVNGGQGFENTLPIAARMDPKNSE
jgi:hypothetical protein